MQGAQRYAVVIGIAKYQDHGTPWLQFADRDADLFHSYLARLGIPSSNVAVVKDEFASTAAIRENIRHVLVDEANAGDDVYVFLSARGIATTYYRGGFILGYMSRLDHPISTAVSTDDLQQLVQQTKANLYVFADLDRDPPGPQLENTIQLAMKSVWQVHPEMTALLGSIPGQRSLENKALDGGHGVFGFYLVNALKTRAIGDQRGEVDLETLFRELQDQLAKSTSRKQAPYELPPQGRSGSQSKKASYSPKQAFLVRASYAPRSSDADEIHRELELPNRSWEEFYAWARRCSPEELMTAYHAETLELQQQTRGWYEIALEDKGEELFVRYGDCDECLEENDPNRLTRKDYMREQLSFDLAATLAPDERLRRSLEAKRQFANGRILTIEGRYADAEQELTDAVKVFPEMPELHNALGTAYLEEGRYAEAISAFRRAVSEAQDWSYARHNLALAYIRDHNYSAAERTYREAITRAPYDASLHLNLGMLLTQLRLTEQAEQEYTRALEVERAQELEVSRRQAAWKARTYDSLAASQAATETSLYRTFVRQAAEIHNAFAALREWQGKSGAARRELAEALRLNPHLLNARYQLAKMNYAIGSDEPDSRAASASVESLQSLLEEAPGYVPARIRLAEIYEDEGRFSRAAEQYDAALKTVNSPVIRALRAQAFGDGLLERGNQRGACEFYHQAEQEVVTADCTAQYKDLLALQNSFLFLATRPNSSAYESGKTADFFFQPCRWNLELVPNVRLDARRVLFLKIDTYCINKPVDTLPALGPVPTPLVSPSGGPMCVNCSPPQIPEPGTFWLAGVGITVAVLIRRKQRRRSRRTHRF